MRLRNPLALLGSHARLAVALSLLAGLALPDLAATVRPYLGVLIFLLLLLAFLRIGFGPLFGVFFIGRTRDFIPRIHGLTRNFKYEACVHQ